VQTDKMDKELKTVLVKQISRPDVIDRIDIDEQEVDRLAENIEKQGLLQAPILRVREDGYEIVAGDRRILAIKQLDWLQVDCVVCQINDAQAAEIRASENLQRVDLSVIEEARIYRNLHRKHGMRIDAIARRMGKSAGVVKRRLDLLKMPECLQDAMHKKLISYGVAEALWPISDPAAMDYYLGFATEHGVTVPIARQWAQDWKSSQRRIEQDGQDPVEALTSPAIRPTYIACDLCEQPELVQDLAIVRICRRCAKQITQIKLGEEE